MFEIVLANDYATLKDRISELEAQLLELQTDTAPVIVTWTIANSTHPHRTGRARHSR